MHHPFGLTGPSRIAQVPEEGLAASGENNLHWEHVAPLCGRSRYWKSAFAAFARACGPIAIVSNANNVVAPFKSTKRREQQSETGAMKFPFTGEGWSKW